MSTIFSINIQINVLPEVIEQYVTYNVVFDVAPTAYLPEQHVRSTVTTLNINPLQINLQEILTKLSSRLISNKISTYYDEDRALKTLLNFGNDLQSVVTNWKYDENDDTGTSIILKLYNPLPSFINKKDTAWISTEISPPLIDQVWIQNTPQAGQLTYLRPPFMDIKISNLNGNKINNSTLTSLISSSNTSTLLVNRNDILDQYYTTDLSGVALNVDYSDYRNFIHFGSAEQRLLAFSTKLESINVYDQLIQQQSASLAFNSASYNFNFLTSSVVLTTLQNYESTKVDIIRSFDGYERFLYYQTNIPYSGTLSTSDVDTIYYHSDGTWPKSGSILYPVTSGSILYAAKYGKTPINESSSNIYPSQLAQPWMDNQLSIAKDYDTQNSNALINNIPQFIIDENQSLDFIKFISMIGHHFDNIKPYIDAMSSIRDRSNSAKLGLSSQLVWHIAKSVGFELPSEYSLRQLRDYTIGNTSLDPLFYSSGEIWKRILHNQIHILKTKGTAESINALMNAYGITPGILQIREGVTPNSELTASFMNVDETAYALNLVSSSYIDIPLATIGGSISSSILTPNSIEVRFATNNLQNNTMTVFNAYPSTWALVLIPTDVYGNGRVIISGSIIASSSIMPIFDGNYNYVSIVYNPSGSFISGAYAATSILNVYKFDGYNINYSSSTSISSGDIIPATNRIMLGAENSNYGQPFSGSIDEFRIWGYPISDTYIDRSVKYPPIYSGDTTASAADSLFVRLSFNKIKNLYTSSVLDNESPYIRNMTGSAPILTFDTYNFTNKTVYPFNFSKITRKVLKYELTSTGNRFVTNNIIIADPPVFVNSSFASASIPQLRIDRSFKTISDKIKYPQPNNYVGVYLSIADSINDSIVRSIGYIDLQEIIGNPQDLYNPDYSLLKKLSQYYWRYYSYNFDQNALIDYIGASFSGFFSQLQNLIPARAKLISGHVIEQNILERNKLQYRPINIQGETKTDSRNTELLTKNTEIDIKPLLSSVSNKLADAIANINQSNIQLSSELENRETNININDNVLTIVANEEMFDTSINTTDNTLISAESDEFNTSLPVYDTQTVINANMENFETIISLIQQKLSVISIGGVIDDFPEVYISISDTYNKFVKIHAESFTSIQYSNYNIFGKSIYDMIQNISDLTKISATTYFTNPSGVYVDYEFIKVRYLQNILTDKGSWTNGSSYFKNDFVIYTFANGSTAEYRCITTELNNSFISNISPDLDHTNWTSVLYIPQKRIKIMKAILYGNDVQIVKYDNSHPAFVGYGPNHYKKHRFSSIGWKRSKYIGCVQTAATTVDGKSPIEITTAKVDQLYVNPGINAPVQQKNNLSGPILDVR